MKRPARKAVETLQIAKQGLADTLREIPKETSERLIQQVGEILEDQIRQERERCASACRRRSDLWRRTTMSQVPGPDGAKRPALGLTRPFIWRTCLPAEAMPPKPALPPTARPVLCPCPVEKGRLPAYCLRL